MIVGRVALFGKRSPQFFGAPGCGGSQSSHDFRSASALGEGPRKNQLSTTPARAPSLQWSKNSTDGTGVISETWGLSFLRMALALSPSEDSVHPEELPCHLPRYLGA